MLGFVGRTISLLSRKEQYQLSLLGVTMIAMAFIEALSIGSIMPFMTVVTRPEVIQTNKWLSLAYNYFHFESVAAFLLVLGIVVLGILVVSNAANAFVTWWITKFAWMRNYCISKRLMKKYLDEPYDFFINRNSSDLEKNILDEVQLIVISILNSMLVLVGNCVSIIFIFGMLIIMDPGLAVIASLVLGSCYGLLYRLTSKLLRKIGKERVEANRERFRYASEAFGGIKVLKVLGREHFFLNRFATYSHIVSTRTARKTVIAQLPKYAFEVLAYGGILLIIIYYLAIGKDISQVVPILSLYAYAGYRLMPAMQAIFNKMANIKYALPSLDILYGDLHHEMSSAQKKNQNLQHGDQPSVDIISDGNIRLKSVTYSYPNQEIPVIKNIDIEIPSKKTIGIAGSTGSGKTTIIDILLGLLEPKTGDLFVGETRIHAGNVTYWQRRIGYVPQDIFLLDESIVQNIAFGIDSKDVDFDAVVDAAKVSNLHDFIVEELPDGYNTVVGERGVRLSGGQRQRIGIARALYHNPDVLILDEATSALDNITEDAIIQAISHLSHKKTIVMVAHRLTTLKACDEIFLLKHGQIMARGTYNTLLETNQYFQESNKLIKFK